MYLSDITWDRIPELCFKQYYRRVGQWSKYSRSNTFGTPLYVRILVLIGVLGSIRSFVGQLFTPVQPHCGLATVELGNLEAVSMDLVFAFSVQ